MGTGYYIVEISSSVSHVYVTAFNVEKPQSLVLTIGEKQARAILEIFEHDFEQMASWLTVEQETRLVLLNPNYNPAMRDHHG
jgi:aromatic ring-cleaving dioxygenase